MITEDRNTDRIFREKLGDFEISPPAFVWDNLQASMVAAKRKKRLVVWRVSSVAAALAIAFIAGWQLSRTPIDELRMTENPVVVQQKELPESAGSKSESVLAEGSSVQTTPENIMLAAKLVSMQNSSEVRKEVPTEISTSQNETPGFMESLKAIFVSVSEKTVDDRLALAGKSTSVLSVEDQRRIEQNKTLLAMNRTGEEQRKWLVGAGVSPVFSVNNTSHSKVYANNMSSSGTQNKLNMGGGFSLEYKTKKRWSVQSGVFYNQMGQSASGNKSYDYLSSPSTSINDSKFYFNNAVTNHNGELELNGAAGVIRLKNIPSNVQMEGSFDRENFAPKALVTDAAFDQSFEYIEVPLLVKYQLVDSRLGLQLLSGVSTHVLVGNSVYMSEDGQRNRVGETVGMTNFAYSGQLGLGMNYSLGSNIYFNIEPRLKYYFRSLNENPGVVYKPYSFGLLTGISFAF